MKKNKTNLPTKERMTLEELIDVRKSSTKTINTLVDTIQILLNNHEKINKQIENKNYDIRTIFRRKTL